MPGKPSRSVSVAVLASVSETPRHSYEIWATMLERGHAGMLGTAATTIYDAVRRLERDGFVEVDHRARVGNRPERTVYRPTASGTEFLRGSLVDMLSEPAGDPLIFEVALSFMFALPRDEVVTRLTERSHIIARQEADREQQLAAAKEHGVAEIFCADQEYRLALIRSEGQWVRDFTRQLGPDDQWPSGRAAPPQEGASQSFGPDGTEREGA